MSTFTDNLDTMSEARQRHLLKLLEALSHFAVAYGRTGIRDLKQACPFLEENDHTQLPNSQEMYRSVLARMDQIRLRKKQREADKLLDIDTLNP